MPMQPRPIMDVVGPVLPSLRVSMVVLPTRAATPVIEPESRGVLDRPVKPDDDSGVWGGALENDNPGKSQHARQYAVRRLVVVEEGADVDDHLFAHLDAALDGGRAHMRQQRHLAGLAETNEFRID